MHGTRHLQVKLKKMDLNNDKNKNNTNDMTDTDEEALLNSDEPTGNEIMQMLKAIRNDTSSTNKSLATYMKETDKKLSGMSAAIDKNTKQIETLGTKFKACETIVSDVKYSNELQKQKLLKNNISIYGIPFNADEDLVEIVKAVFKFYNIELNVSSISGTYRVKKSVNLIVVKFKDFEMKDLIMKAKSEKILKLTDLFATSSATNEIIYINNHTSPFFGKLLYHGRQCVKEKKLFSCWISSNGFMVRKTENSSPAEMKSVEHLMSFVNATTNKTKRGAPDDKASPSSEHTQPKNRPRRNR